MSATIWINEIMTAQTAAPFETRVKAFADAFRQSQGDYVGEVAPFQVRSFDLTDRMDYEQALLAASKFRATDLFWLEPLTVQEDGHAHCRFKLAYFTPTEEKADV